MQIILSFVFQSDPQLQAIISALSIMVPLVLEQSFKQRRYSESQKSLPEQKTVRGNSFRADLLRHLGYDNDDVMSSSNRNAAVKLTCMASGVSSSGMDNIRAAHIIPAVSELKDIAKLNLTERDVDNVRNGLLLSKQIERAFDAYEISFVRDPLHRSSLVMKFWNPESQWKEKPLFKDCDRNIGEFEGRALNLRFVDNRAGCHIPFLRGLAYQAFQAYLKWNFLKTCTVPDDYTSDNSLSSGFNQERLVYLQYQAVRDAQREEKQQQKRQLESAEDGDGGGEEGSVRDDSGFESDENRVDSEGEDVPFHQVIPVAAELGRAADDDDELADQSENNPSNKRRRQL